MSAISLPLVANHSTPNPCNDSQDASQRVIRKEEEGQEGDKEGQEDTDDLSMPTSDSDESQSILTQGALEGCLAGGSDEEDGHGGEGGGQPGQPGQP